MKKLLIILIALMLFIPIMNGQGNDTIKIKFKDNSRISAETLEYFAIGEDALYDKTKHKSQVITDATLFEYETDCYNDSVHIGDITQASFDGVCWFDLPVVAHVSYYKHIRHKEIKVPKQPTFKGFINWLHKKQNNK